MIYAVGFTGTQEGMTDKQKSALRRVLYELSGGQFHHGDCIGADAEAAEIARSISYLIVNHPPTNPQKRAYVRADHQWPDKPYLVRNREIVSAVDIMIACPNSNQEKLRSGTWATIRHARGVNKTLYLIFPNGKVQLETSQEKHPV